ncbi:MAG: glutamate ABC transporter substrate-binding protein [Dermatophilaceae bacterium]
MSRRWLLLAALVSLLLVAAGCGSGRYADTVLPATSATASGGGSPTAAPSAPTCPNATQSYDPLPSLPPAGQLTGRLAQIRDRGYLIAGVSADTQLLGARNPLTGQIEGFDIDVVSQVARAIFGDPSKVQLVVITAADRIPVLQNRTVDIVVRALSMTCARWNDIAFSSVYYQAGQKILVPKGSTATTLGDLSGKKVCAPAGTSSLAKLAEFPSVIPVAADTHTGCLVLFQQSAVDAITGDDTVLAGLVDQDPYAFVPPGAPITSEPYGIGFNKDGRGFVQYVNRVLADMRSDGRWQASYERWLQRALGPASPPAATYGRT